MPFRSWLELCSRQRVAGWAWQVDVEDPVSLVMSANGAVVGRCLADRFRPDLVEAGIGSGRHAFDLTFPQALSFADSQIVSVRREDDGAHIKGSPFTIEAATTFDDHVRTSLQRLLTAVETDAEFEQRLAFLHEQVDTLRQRHAERRSGIRNRQTRRRLGWQDPDALAAKPVADAGGPTALVVDNRMPDARRDAGSTAILSHMRSLQRLGYEVFFAPLGLQGDPSALQDEGITCCLKPWYGTIEEVLQRQRGTFDLVYLHRLDCAGLYGPLVRHLQPKARLIYSVADLQSLRLARQAKIEDRADLAAYARRLQIMELGAVWHADAVITHSSAEAEILGRQVRRDKIHVVPWFVPMQPTGRPFAERRGLAFIGGYDHQPNIDAARWLVEAIMPHVASGDPAVPCFLVGSGMPDSVRRLRRDNVEPIGHVETLDEIFDKVRLTVAPLAYGAGLKGKVMASLAAGIPCACTPVAAEGLALPPLLVEQVAAEPANLAAIIDRLHADEALNRRCAEAGLSYVAASLSTEVVDAKLRLAAGA